MITWKEVLSDMVAEVGYDDETGDLLVRWAKGGKTSAYSGVPPEIADEASRSWSVGNYLNENIKNTYPHRYV